MGRWIEIIDANDRDSSHGLSIQTWTSHRVGVLAQQLQIGDAVGVAGENDCRALPRCVT
jgi:hypothetical protein